MNIILIAKSTHRVFNGYGMNVLKSNIFFKKLNENGLDFKNDNGKFSKLNKKLYYLKGPDPRLGNHSEHCYWCLGRVWHCVDQQEKGSPQRYWSNEAENGERDFFCNLCVPLCKFYFLL